MQMRNLNCPLNPLLDKRGGSLELRKTAVASIGCFQDEFDLVDIWRVKNPETKSFTWCQSSPKIFCRLDYWFISNNLHDWIQTTDKITAIKTDHSAIKLVVEDNELNQIKCPGFWKMNRSILEDANYIDEISHLIPQWAAESQKEISDHRNVWEWIKFNIRDHAIQFSKSRARKRKERGVQLEILYIYNT